MSEKDNQLNKRDRAKKLTEREKGRDVSVWFESKSNFMHPLKEIVANSTDEINNNFDEGVVTITLENDMKTISINDTGRGIPLEVKGEDDEPYWELFLLTLFAGTNYDNEESGKITTGEHGLGLTVTNYCSSKFKIISYREKFIGSMSFIDGGVINEEFSLKDNTEGITGTYIEFKLDEEIFGDYKYDPEEIKSIINKLAGSNSKIKFIFQFNNEIFEYHYSSLEEYFDTITNLNTSSKIIGVTKSFGSGVDYNTIEIVFCTCGEPIQESFLNITHLPYGGTINEGVIDGVRKFINSNLDSKSTQVSAKDVEDSLSFVVNVMSVKSEFANQTKLSTKKKLYKTIVSQYVRELLEIFKLENEKEFSKFTKHIFEVQKFNAKSQANKKALKKKLSEKISIVNKVEGLYDCKSKNKDENMICICEGKSALTSLLDGRQNNQAVFPIRGKILNCLKASYEKIFSNDIVMNFYRALGCGIEVSSKHNKELHNFSYENLRYSKILIVVDADFDGIGSILPLILTVLYKLSPSLIRDGRVYLCETPKYEIQLNNDKYLYAIDDKELKDKKIELKDKKYKVHYVKGLAELNPETMAYCLSPEYKNITKITMEQAEESIKSLELFMGDNIKNRKEHILNEF